jgi:hypothetical protein
MKPQDAPTPPKGSHPIDAILPMLSKHDIEIANEFYEQGFSDEDLYQALPNNGADKLLKRTPRCKTKYRDADAMLEARK